MTCRCEESKKKPIGSREWYVTQYKPAYRNGTRSKFSCVYCARCGEIWSTKANYVELLRLCSMTTAREIAEELREART